MNHIWQRTEVFPSSLCKNVALITQKKEHNHFVSVHFHLQSLAPLFYSLDSNASLGKTLTVNLNFYTKSSNWTVSIGYYLFSKHFFYPPSLWFWDRIPGAELKEVKTLTGCCTIACFVNLWKWILNTRNHTHLRTRSQTSLSLSIHTEEKNKTGNDSYQFHCHYHHLGCSTG